MKMPLKSAAVLFTATCAVLFAAIAKAEDPYLFFNWNVTYGTIYPLGVPQQVCLIYYLRHHQYDLMWWSTALPSKMSTYRIISPWSVIALLVDLFLLHLATNLEEEYIDGFF